MVKPRIPQILVIGGAGYVGSHICASIFSSGWAPVVLDNLSYGHRDAARFGPFIHGSTQDILTLSDAIRDCDVVIHCAAYMYVEESVKNPAIYYRNNLSYSLNILDVIRRANPRVGLIFSSSCAVYGQPPALPLNEDSPCQPISPYGRSKWMVEQIIEDYARAYQLRAIRLRYFNAVGADESGVIGEDHNPELHLIPQLLRHLLRHKSDKVAFEIHGDDYPTRDGSPIREYIHVCDLAEAHVLATHKLLDGNSGDVFNLGTGKGTSVLEVIQTVREVTGRDIDIQIATRRPGDPAELVSDFNKAQQILGWVPHRDFRQAISDAWTWHKHRHPNG
ncbi:MAG: UDP-glucose 4-epimerase GalE [Nitrospirae bacterium]|nr:UDP-glucose 4-epimerase GalE [Nitrospirota bacterium]